MEEQISDALNYLHDAINMMMVLNDSLELSFKNDKNNDYQFTVAQNILNELNQVLAELDIVNCKLCKKGAEISTPLKMSKA